MQTINNFIIRNVHFFYTPKIFYSWSKRISYEKYLSGILHFHQNPTRFSPNWRTGAIRSSSRCVRQVAEEGPTSSSLAGWTHLKVASTVKWARHLLLLLVGHFKVFQPQWSELVFLFSWSTVKWAHHLLLLLDGHIKRPQLFRSCSFARWNVSIWPCSTEIA